MKTIILFTLILFEFSSCGTHHVISHLSISTTTEGNELTVAVKAIDNDGIASVIINIEALNVHNVYRNIAGKQWNYRQRFVVVSDDQSDTSEIKVTLIDSKGNENIEIAPLSLTN